MWKQLTIQYDVPLTEGRRQKPRCCWIRSTSRLQPTACPRLFFCWWGGSSKRRRCCLFYCAPHFVFSCHCSCSFSEPCGRNHFHWQRDWWQAGQWGHRSFAITSGTAQFTELGNHGFSAVGHPEALLGFRGRDAATASTAVLWHDARTATSPSTCTSIVPVDPSFRVSPSTTPCRSKLSWADWLGIFWAASFRCASCSIVVTSPLRHIKSPVITINVGLDTWFLQEFGKIAWQDFKLLHRNLWGWLPCWYPLVN